MKLVHGSVVASEAETLVSLTDAYISYKRQV